MKNNENDYVIRLMDSPLEVNPDQWNGLLSRQASGSAINPFMRHEYLTALHESKSASPDSGWTPRFVTLWKDNALAGACAVYLKTHSYGEYVFDHAWANAYHQHGLPYYPKALVAVPFTPVPGARLLARNAAERKLLLQALVAWCREENLSSLHLLFANEADVAACQEAGLMLRHTVQFHWTNQNATALGVDRPIPGKFCDFDDFLMSLTQEKRKKIRQERRKVSEAGITFRWSRGHDITTEDWDFFYRCYERTYYEHGNAPYLSRDFFTRMKETMAENWVLFVAEHTAADGSKQAIASSLIAISAIQPRAGELIHTENGLLEPVDPPQLTAYGRYWGGISKGRLPPFRSLLLPAPGMVYRPWF